ncbi:MAG: GtrA-like protein [Methanocella sp. PtaU1.Bin125]|nr:MAG: GtrA-like protein [Methanocella sp. PtaU1.Bin125]
MIEVIKKADTAFVGVYRDYKKLVKALMVGVLATLVDMAFLYIFKNYLDVFYLTAQAMSYLIGMSVSFYFNKTFTFRNRSNQVHFQFASFSIIAFTQYLLTLGLMFVFVDMVFNNPDSNVIVMVSKVIVAFIGFVYAFTLNKSLTFKIFK